MLEIIRWEMRIKQPRSLISTFSLKRIKFDPDVVVSSCVFGGRAAPAMLAVFSFSTEEKKKNKRGRYLRREKNISTENLWPANCSRRKKTTTWSVPVRVYRRITRSLLSIVFVVFSSTYSCTRIAVKSAYTRSLKMKWSFRRTEWSFLITVFRVKKFCRFSLPGRIRFRARTLNIRILRLKILLECVERSFG